MSRARMALHGLFSVWAILGDAGLARPVLKVEIRAVATCDDRALPPGTPQNALRKVGSPRSRNGIGPVFPGNFGRRCRIRLGL
jgi:hypothetical protein